MQIQNVDTSASFDLREVIETFIGQTTLFRAHRIANDTFDGYETMVNELPPGFYGLEMVESFTTREPHLNAAGVKTGERVSIKLGECVSHKHYDTFDDVLTELNQLIAGKRERLEAPI